MAKPPWFSLITSVFPAIKPAALVPIENAPALLLELSPSRYLLAYLLLLHGATAISVMFYPLPVGWLALAVLLVLWHGWYSCRRLNNPANPHWISHFEYSNRGFWIAGYAGVRGVYVAGATVWGWLVVINLVGLDDGCRYTLRLFPDSCADQQLRRLKVFLRHCLKSGMFETGVI